MEKAIRVLKDLKKLSELGQISQRKLLGRVTYLLKLLSSNSNILAPDISKQLAANKTGIDAETKAWLLAQIGKQQVAAALTTSKDSSFRTSFNREVRFYIILD